jgi:hypothetical protein
MKDTGTFKDQTLGDPTDPIGTLRGNDRQAPGMLFDQYRQRLRRMVELRLDPRLRARFDASRPAGRGAARRARVAGRGRLGHK